MTRGRLLIGVTAVVTFSIGCTDDHPGTNTGNGIVVGLTSTNPLSADMPVGIDADGTAFVIESAEAVVRRIEFDLPDGEQCNEADIGPPLNCEGSEIELEAGPYLIDLITRTSTPPIDVVQLPSRAYKRVDVRFDDLEDDEPLVPPGDPLFGNTIHATGMFEYEGDTVEFELTLDFDEDGRFENPGGVPVTDGSQVLLLLDVARWFSALPITQCLRDGDLSIVGGTLTIADDRGSCSAVEQALKEAIKNSGQLDESDD